MVFKWTHKHNLYTDRQRIKICSLLGGVVMYGRWVWLVPKSQTVDQFVDCTSGPTAYKDDCIFL